MAETLHGNVSGHTKPRIELNRGQISELALNGRSGLASRFGRVPPGAQTGGTPSCPAPPVPPAPGTNTYHAIVIGGGHNGLVAGAYLARSGAKTARLGSTAQGWRRRRHHGAVAGGSRVQGHHAQLRHEPDADTIQRDLKLADHGYKAYPVGPYFLPFPDGRCIVQYDDDAKKNYESFAQFSKHDADAIERWDAWIGGLADVLGPMLMSIPPTVGSKKPADLYEQLRLAWRFRGLDVKTIGDVTRLMTMSIVDILDRFFETDQVKTVMALNGLIGTWAGPYEPGTGYVMAHHSIGDVGDGHLGAWAGAGRRHGRRQRCDRGQRAQPSAPRSARMRGSRGSSPRAARDRRGP